MYALLMAYALALGNPTGHDDCGRVDHLDLISKTESIVEKKGKLVMPITEIPDATGKKACVRLEFSVSRRGRAINIKEGDSSGSYIMNVAGVRALKRYKFRYVSGNARYTLIFSGIVGAAPAYKTN